ncbi:MAG: MarR family transcriptional regulator [Luteolibacter sp.]
MPLQQMPHIHESTESHQVAWRLLLTVHAHAYRRIDDELQKSGLLTFNDYDVLLTLNEAEKETLRMSELAEAVLLSNSGMSRRVTALVNSGLVTRTQSKNDGRVYWVKLTTKGRKAIVNTWKAYKPLIEDLFSQHLSEAEAKTMAQLLQKVLTGTGLPQYRELLKKHMTDAPKPKP